MNLADAVALYEGRTPPSQLTQRWWCVVDRMVRATDRSRKILAVYGAALHDEAQRIANHAPFRDLVAIGMPMGTWPYAGQYLTVDGRLVDTSTGGSIF